LKILKINIGGALYDVEFLEISNGKKFNEVIKPSNSFEVVESRNEFGVFQRIDEKGDLIFLNEDEEELIVPSSLIPNSKMKIFDKYLNEVGM